MNRTRLAAAVAVLTLPFTVLAGSPAHAVDPWEEPKVQYPTACSVYEMDAKMYAEGSPGVEMHFKDCTFQGEQAVALLVITDAAGNDLYRETLQGPIQAAPFLFENAPIVDQPVTVIAVAGVLGSSSEPLKVTRNWDSMTSELADTCGVSDVKATYVDATHVKVTWTPTAGCDTQWDTVYLYGNLNTKMGSRTTTWHLGSTVDAAPGEYTFVLDRANPKAKFKKLTMTAQTFDMAELVRAPKVTASK